MSTNEAGYQIDNTITQRMTFEHSTLNKFKAERTKKSWTFLNGFIRDGSLE